MAGTALFTEGMNTNPFAFDLFTEMAWRSEPVDAQAWMQAYVENDETIDTRPPLSQAG